jgi:hypothetical protein
VDIHEWSACVRGVSRDLARVHLPVRGLPFTALQKVSIEPGGMVIARRNFSEIMGYKG